jgi:hypothetical protein
MTREIPLTRGYTTIVDDEDYDWATQWKWHAHLSPHQNTVYAKRTVEMSGQKWHLVLHRELSKRLGFTAETVDHKNGDGLDNRRANLRPASVQQQQRNRPKRRGALSKYKGVWRYRDKWRAQVSYGLYCNERDAISAYEAVAHAVPARSGGVCRCGTKWRVRFYVAYSDNEAEAAHAYDAAARTLYGEFAVLNFPEVRP